MSERCERGILLTILTLFVALGGVYSIVVPPFEASDELWHYPMVETIARNGRLPVQDPDNVGPWRQEGSQAPLYYAIGALATFWIDTSDMATVRQLNPHVDNGAAMPDGNINLVVHRPEREAFPWRGTVLALHIVRLLSVAMSAFGVYLTWRIARRVVPGRRLLALATTGVHAFTPMVVFIAGAVNNDNLVVPLSSLALLQMIALVQKQEALSLRRTLRRYVALGAVLGLAALTKSSSLALTLLTALIVTIRARRQRSWREFFVGALATLIPLLLIAGWWYLRNWRLYGDPSGLNVFIEILGQRDVPAGLRQLWRERFSFMAGYWGNFGGLNVPMAAWVYSLLNGLAIAAAVGWGVVLLREALRRWMPRWRRPSGLRALAPLPFALCLLWGAGVVIPWSQWAATTWSSQGRLIFAALPVWSLLLTLGLSVWLPLRWGRWVAVLFACGLLTLSLLAPSVWIAPAYVLPQAPTSSDLTTLGAGDESVDFGGIVRLLAYDVAPVEIEPGGQVTVTLAWQALDRSSIDYSVFVHLTNEHDLVIAQRDTYPGLGRLSTTWLTPGSRWLDRYVLQVPQTAYTPDVARVELGLYDARTGQRLPATPAADGESLGDHVSIGRVRLPETDGHWPNPVALTFGHRMLLRGYDLDRQVVAPGEVLEVTLYWEALRVMEANYTVSVQVVDWQQRKAAQDDRWPTLPTSAWTPGEVLEDVHQLAIAPDAVPGAYDLRLVVYLFDEATGVQRVPFIPDGGRMLANDVVLTGVRVGGP
jgi:4-amino-4-deoxy-L-arabinose transferase-like glycosyltransferase